MTAATAATPIAETFLPPAEFYAYLDTFVTETPLGAALGLGLGPPSPSPSSSPSSAPSPSP